MIFWVPFATPSCTWDEATMGTCHHMWQVQHQCCELEQLISQYTTNIERLLEMVPTLYVFLTRSVLKKFCQKYKTATSHTMPTQLVTRGSSKAKTWTWTRPWKKMASWMRTKSFISSVWTMSSFCRPYICILMTTWPRPKHQTCSSPTIPVSATYGNTMVFENFVVCWLHVVHILMMKDV